MEEKFSREEMKKLAIEIMKKLDIYKPYINGFKTKDEVCFFENYAGFWAWQEPELEQKIKEIEKENGGLVYAVTHEFTEFGEIYDFLYVSPYKEDEDYNLDENYAYAYCWNKDEEMFSEFGTITIKSFGGGIKRIG